MEFGLIPPATVAVATVTEGAAFTPVATRSAVIGTFKTGSPCQTEGPAAACATRASACGGGRKAYADFTLPTPGVSLAMTVVVPLQAAPTAMPKFSRSPAAADAMITSPAETSQVSFTPAAMTAVDSFGRVKAPSIWTATGTPSAALVTGIARIVPRMKGTPATTPPE